MARHAKRRLLFEDDATGSAPRAAPLFQPDRIILTRGCGATPDRARLVEGICRAYPDAEVLDRADLSHNQVDLACDRPLDRHRVGKRTLVLGEHKSAVRFSSERLNCCPNYWHFSPYGFCPYGCTYCYLAGTRGVWFSPTVKIFLNLDEMLGRIDRIARRAARPTAFYLGKLQDGLAMDLLSGYSRRMIPFFAGHPFARLVVLTKSSHVGNLLALRPEGRTVLSWSLSTMDVWRRYEPGTPSPAERLEAMRLCAQAGYRIRAVVMPIVPVGPWRQAYDQLLEELLATVPVERITLGGICSFPNAMRLMNDKLGDGNEINRLLSSGQRSADGRRRFRPALRVECYRHVLESIRNSRPDLTVGLCMEERETFRQLRLDANIGKCNCVL